ncbi:MAG: hypothetical protein Q8916_08920 [Bacteroidota bacterium]|nr:hypothetical protein [Bacteroidota bacterium]
MAIWSKRSLLIGAVLYALVSIAIISLSSPLFRILGFEYSGCIALFSSLYLLFYSGSEAAKPGQSGIGGRAGSLLLPIFVLSSIPLAISLLSAFFIPNCSIADGILFYIEIVYPTALIAGMCGIAIGSLPISPNRRNSYLALLWIGSFIISLLPGYFTAKIFTYGWQYGYFPGFVWDEAIELHSAYWISRIIEIALIGAWLNYYRRVRGKPIGARRSWQFTIMIVVFVLSTVMIGKEFFDFPIHSYLEKEIITGQIHIHYAPGGLSTDELQLEKVKIADDVKEIEHVYGLALPSEIDIYIFPSTEALYEYVGTREASISKPWRHAVYIAKQNLRSLKHELAHAMLAGYGSFPFDISWSTGLTEKAAMAIDKFLGGRGSIEEKFAPVTEPEKRLGQEEGFAGMTRCEEMHTPPGERIHSFCKVVEDMDERSAVNESKRCLQCDLRLMIKPVKFWVNY